MPENKCDTKKAESNSHQNMTVLSEVPKCDDSDFRSVEDACINNSGSLIEVEKSEPINKEIRFEIKDLADTGPSRNKVTKEIKLTIKKYKIRRLVNADTKLSGENRNFQSNQSHAKGIKRKSDKKITSFFSVKQQKTSQSYNNNLKASLLSVKQQQLSQHNFNTFSLTEMQERTSLISQDNKDNLNTSSLFAEQQKPSSTDQSMNLRTLSLSAKEQKTFPINEPQEDNISNSSLPVKQLKSSLIRQINNDSCSTSLLSAKLQSLNTSFLSVKTSSTDHFTNMNLSASLSAKEQRKLFKNQLHAGNLSTSFLSVQQQETSSMSQDNANNLNTSLLSAKQQLTSSIHQPSTNNLNTASVSAKQQKKLIDQCHNDNLNTLENSAQSHLDSVESSKVKEVDCNNAIESGSNNILKCCLRGCGKKFRKQKSYDTHLKHFHGVFKFKTFDPIITAAFYDCKKKAVNGFDSKNKPIHSESSSTNSKDKNIEKNGTIKLPSDNQSSLGQNSKLQTKTSDSVVLLPSSLTKGVEAVSSGKKISEVISNDICQKKGTQANTHKDLNSSKRVISGKSNPSGCKGNFKKARSLSCKDDFEKRNSSNCEGNFEITNVSSSDSKSEEANFSSLESTLENTNSSNFVSNWELQKFRNSEKTKAYFETLIKLRNIFINNEKKDGDKSQNNLDDTEYIQPPSECEELSNSNLNNTIQEEHLYAVREKCEVFESYEDFINKKAEEFLKKSSSEKDLVSDLGKNGDFFKKEEKLNNDIECEPIIFPEPNVGSSYDMCNYKEFVEQKENEHLDLTIPLQNKVSMLKEINKIKNIESQSKKTTAIPLSLALQSSFNSINRLKSIISHNSSIVSSKNVKFIHQSLNLCNHAKNLREVLVKCKRVIESLGSYIISEAKNTLLPDLKANEEKANKLFHYVFFLDVLRDNDFTSIYIPHVLTQKEINVVNRLFNPVSLYLTNTETELPNVKLRRDKEFLQRNSDFFRILLKIQKASYILPYAQSPISVEELYDPSTKIRLEKSEYFAQVLLDIQTKKSHILMPSYGSEKDLRASPYVECICDEYNAHKLIGLVLLPRPNGSMKKDMCVGLCFESTSFSLKDCIFKLSSIAEEIKENLSEVHTKMLKEIEKYGSTEIRRNLLNIFELISAETNTVFSSLSLIGLYVNKFHERSKDNLVETEKELMKESMREINRILADWLALKECDSLKS